MSTRAFLSSVALLLLVLLGAEPASCMFEDQAGAYDWYKQFVGPVTQAKLHRKRLYLGSERNVVGALNLRDGSIVWRRLLEDGDMIDALEMVENPSVVLTLSGNGTTLRAWHQLDGGLKWQLGLKPKQQEKPALEGKAIGGSPRGMMESSSYATSKPSMVIKYSDDGSAIEVVVVSHGELKVVDPVDGSLLVSRTLAGFSPFASTHVQRDAEGVYMAFGYIPGSLSIQASTFSSDMSSEALTVSEPLSKNSVVGPTGLAVLSDDQSAICLAGPSAAQCTQLSLLAPELPASGQLRLTATSSGFLVVSADQGQPGAALIQVAAAGEIQPALVAYFPTASAVTDTVDSASGEVVGLVEVKEGMVSLSVVLTGSGKEVFTETMPQVEPTVSSLVADRKLEAQPMVVQDIYLGSYKRKDKPDGFRLMVVWRDQYVSLHQQGVTVWGREEALGTVTSTLFVDLPGPAPTGTSGGSADDASAAAAVSTEGTTDLNKFMYMQLLNVKHQFKFNTPEESVILARLREQLSDKNQPLRDGNGFRKLVLCLTSAGKLLALHNGDGRVVWSRSYDASVDGGVPQFLLNWRTFHDLAHAPQVALLYAGPGGRDSFVSIVNAHTGSEVQRVQLGYSADKIIATHVQLSTDGHSEQNIYMVASVGGVAGSAPQVHLLPDTESSREWFVTHYRQLYFWAFDESAVAGYGFDGTAVAAALEEREDSENMAVSLPAVQIWQAALPNPVLAVATRDPTEPIASSVKVLGDRSIMYKYLNPNTLFIATGKAAGETQTQNDPARLTVLVLDTVTGRVLYSQTHNLARGPVRAVFAEHQIVYDFWDGPAARRSTVSIELYDATPREFSVLDYLFNPNSTRPVSSFIQAPVRALSQAFYPRVAVSGMATTRTGMGITSKWLLMLTSAGQVLAMDSRMVDPRRPKTAKPSKEDIEERLIPYNEMLPLVPNHFLTRDKQVLGLRAVDVAPSRLESTTLLLARGLDLFYTRIAPAKAYDSLEDDFAYGLLVMALAGLAGASAMMHWWTKKSILNSKWA